MKCLSFALAVLATAFPAQGGLLYTFSYTATSGTVQSFTFSMFSPTFIGPGPADLDPFTITDDHGALGSEVVTMTQALVGISGGTILGSTLLPEGDGCFSFGSPAADLAQYNGCAGGIPANTGYQADLTVDIPRGLPSQTGTFSNLIFDGGVSPSDAQFFNCCGGASGSMQLVVVQTPEPLSFGLVAVGLSVFGSLLLAKACNGRRAEAPGNKKGP